MKIYIIGAPGSGKTTLARQLSEKYQIKWYELDKIVFDDDNGNIRRSDEEIEKLFLEILNNESWIIEDIGRSKLKKGRVEADKIYYIKLPKLKGDFRIIKRWLRQKIGKESYNYPPTIAQLIDFFKIFREYNQKEKSKLTELEEHPEKLVFLDEKKLKELIN